MLEVLYSIDLYLFHFINQTLSNPVGDVLWPLITDYDKLLPARIVLIGVWLLLLVKGGTGGRTAALLIIPVIFAADTLSSKFIKELVARPRPCHVIDQATLHMLVTCGPGKSFPSSHAVNNFAVAMVFSFFFGKWKSWFFGWAFLVALSRPAVGVHYPSDIVSGAVIGMLIAWLIIRTWLILQQRFFPRFAVIEGEESDARI